MDLNPTIKISLLAERLGHRVDNNIMCWVSNTAQHFGKTKLIVKGLFSVDIIQLIFNLVNNLLKL